MLIWERKFALMLTSLGVTLGHTVRWPECLKQQKVLKCDTVNLDVMMTETGAAAGSQQECKPASNSINTPVGSSESDFLILSRQTTNNWINRSSSVYLTFLSQSTWQTNLANISANASGRHWSSTANQVFRFVFSYNQDSSSVIQHFRSS